VLVVAGCHAFDPVSEVPHQHREVRDAAAAIEMILHENPAPRVYAIGEYHQTHATADETSSLVRFTHDIVPLLEPHAHHMLVETWEADACRTKAAVIEKVIDRPNTTQMELLDLRKRSLQVHLQPHDLSMTCLEQDALLDPHKGIDYVLLLEVVTQKLHEATEILLAEDPDHAVIVYGGALHNDLYPRWPLEELSYAAPLARKHGPGSVLEIDLIVPEIVAPLPMVRDEPWFPLLARASPERTIVWRRGPSSYVVILPAKSEVVGEVARPRQVM
jgi:hypothetical protein